MNEADTKRDPRIDPRPGDVLIPVRGHKSPTLVTSIIETLNWHVVEVAQPFIRKPLSVEFDTWLKWMDGAEVIHAAE